MTTKLATSVFLFFAAMNATIDVLSRIPETYQDDRGGAR